MKLEDYLENDFKVYVEVNTRHRSDGRILPLSFIWEDGREYQIDKILDIRPAASLKGGGTGLRYTVLVRSHQTHLWLEEGQDVQRWFMERKNL